MRHRLQIPVVGQRFGYLTVISNDEHIGARRACKCRCCCGAIKVVRNEHIVKGLIKSCGCLRRRTAAQKHYIHGGKGTGLYVVWKGIRERCNNPNSTGHKNYHDKGIRLSKEWNDFSKFREWAINSGYKKGLSIDRIDNDKGYSEDNCRWADRDTQSRNRRVTILVSFDGREITLKDLSSLTGIAYGTLYNRWVNSRPLIPETNNKKENTK